VRSITGEFVHLFISSSGHLIFSIWSFGELVIW